MPELGGHKFAPFSLGLSHILGSKPNLYPSSYGGELRQGGTKIHFLGGRGTRSCICVHNMGVLVFPQLG